MRLSEAYNLLLEDGIADNHRYFAEMYKGFQFKDDDLLKDYIDFILHEPVHWMRGFPPKLTSKNAFAKPKTAVIKLLKKPEVQSDLGEAAAELAYTTIWTVFKRECDGILAERTAHGGRRGEPCIDTDSITVASIEEEPLPNPPQPCVPRLQISQATELTDQATPATPTTQKTDRERIDILKAVCLKLSETLPSSVTDAFRILIAAV